MLSCGLLHIWCYSEYLVLQDSVCRTESRSRASVDLGLQNNFDEGVDMHLCECMFTVDNHQYKPCSHSLLFHSDTVVGA